MKDVMILEYDKAVTQVNLAASACNTAMRKLTFSVKLAELDSDEKKELAETVGKLEEMYLELTKITSRLERMAL